MLHRIERVCGQKKFLSKLRLEKRENNGRRWVCDFLLRETFWKIYPIHLIFLLRFNEPQQQFPWRVSISNCVMLIKFYSPFILFWIRWAGDIVHLAKSGADFIPKLANWGVQNTEYNIPLMLRGFCSCYNSVRVIHLAYLFLNKNSRKKFWSLGL